MKQDLCNEANLFDADTPDWTAQQAGATRTGAKAPEETPPNNDSAAKRQIIPLKDPPWNEWLRLARQGDKNAIHRFCIQAEPFIKRLCNTRYFRERLGKEEVRSTATLALMDFLMNHPNPPDDPNLPNLLKRIMHNQILAQLRNQKVRKKHEVYSEETEDTDGAETAQCSIANYPAKRKEEPEAKLLSKELQNATAEAMQQLPPCEQAAIRALFFQNKTVAAIAKELQCTRQNVEKLRVRALRRLRRFFEGQGFNDGAFCH